MGIAETSKAKHTPGPFKIVEWGDEFMATRMIANGKAEQVVASFDSHVSGESAILKDESEANARLFVAAPELLEALKWSNQFACLPGESHSACFDRIAEVFHRETGFLRPGKDAVQSKHTAEDHQAAWGAWITLGVDRVRVAIAKAEGGVS